MREADRSGVAFEGCVPAEGVEHEWVEVVAEEAKDEVQRRFQIADCRLQIPVNGFQIVRAGTSASLAVGCGCWLRARRENLHDFGGRGVEKKGEGVEAGGVEARS